MRQRSNPVSFFLARCSARLRPRSDHHPEMSEGGGGCCSCRRRKKRWEHEDLIDRERALTMLNSFDDDDAKAKFATAYRKRQVRHWEALPEHPCAPSSSR